MNKRKIGKEKEDMAVSFLKGQKAEILERNFNCRLGEIDIILRDKEYLVFVEVKYRKNTDFGYPEEAVSFQKRNKICMTSKYYLLTHPEFRECQVRYDVVSILGNEISWNKNAFYYEGF